ncbi:phage holin family protein [Pseudonocardia benzenivorans]
MWAATAVALVMLDRLLPGFEMDSWWQPVVCALLLGLLTAIGWPPVARLVLPLALFTLGVGGFLLMGAGVAAVFLVVPGVHIHDFRAAVVVAVALAAVGAVISSLLALDEDEIFFRRAARRAAAPPPPIRTRYRACCSCRSTASDTTSSDARCATATCPRWRAGSPRADTS